MLMQNLVAAMPLFAMRMLFTTRVPPADRTYASSSDSLLPLFACITNKDGQDHSQPRDASAPTSGLQARR